MINRVLNKYVAIIANVLLQKTVNININARNDARIIF